jgi:MFS family permease
MLRAFRSQSRTVQVLLINELTIYLSFTMLYPYLALHFTRDLGFATWTVGLILGIRTLSQQGLTVIGGTLADRLGPKPVIIAGLALRTVGFGLFGLTDSLAGVLLAAILSGLAGALFSPALRAYLASESAGERAELFALSNVFGQTGNLTGPLLGVLLLRLSFSAVCLCAAGMFLLLMLLQVRYLPSHPRAATGPAPSVWQEWGEVARNRPFVLFSLAIVGNLVLYNQLYLGIPLEVSRLTGSDSLIGFIFIVPSLLTIAAQVWITARCRARLRPPQAIAAGLALMGLAFVPILLAIPFLPLGTVGGGAAGRLAAQAINLSPVLLTIALLALGLMVAQPFSLELIPSLARERLLGTYFGFYSVASAIGVTIGNTVTGAAFDAARENGLLALPWLVMIGIGLASGLATATLDWRGLLRGTAPAQGSKTIARAQ